MKPHIILLTVPLWIESLTSFTQANLHSITIMLAAMADSGDNPIIGHGGAKIALVVGVIFSLIAGTVTLKKTDKDNHLKPIIFLILMVLSVVAAIIFLYQTGQGNHPIPPPERANFLNWNTHHFYELVGSILALIFSIGGIIWLILTQKKEGHSHVGPATLSFVCALQLLVTFIILL